VAHIYILYSVKTCIFDFDGTIADTWDSYVKIIAKEFPGLKVENVSPEEMVRMRGVSILELIKEFQIPMWKFLWMAFKVERSLFKSIDTVKAFEGMPELLNDLKEEGYSLFILTSNTLGNVNRFFEANNISAFAKIYNIRGLIGKDKKLLKIIKENNLNKSSVIYIGDEIRDIEASRKIGIKSVAVGWGFNSEDALRKSDPDFYAKTVADLKKAIASAFV
jgi:phosphoglycolate phosphatase